MVPQTLPLRKFSPLVCGTFELFRSLPGIQIDITNFGAVLLCALTTIDYWVEFFLYLLD